MQMRLLGEGPQRIFSLVFDPGDEAMEGLDAFARREGLRDASVTGIGALQAVTLARYNDEAKRLEPIPLPEEQVEVLSFIGEITTPQDKPNVHVHVVLGRRDGTTWGGHLVRAVVRPMLVLTVAESDRPLIPHQS